MFRTTHTFYCKICNAELSIAYQSDLAQNFSPILPMGWIQLPDGYVCDSHIIEIKDKEEEVGA